MAKWLEIFKKFGPVVVEGAGKLADNLVKGEKLNKDQKQGLYMAYVCLRVGADDIAESVNKELFTMSIDELTEFCADTLTEAGIPLPEIPEALLEE